MADEPTNDVTFVDLATDDLDAFDDLLRGKAQVKEQVDVKEKEEVVTPPLEDDNQEAGNEGDSQTNENDDLNEVDGESKPEEKPAKKVNRFQERINELTAKAREAERALEELRKAQTAKPNETAPTQATSVTVQDTGPTPDDKLDDGSDKYPLGEFDPSYIRDMARHTIDSEWKAKKEQEAQELAQRNTEQARAYLQEQWTEKLAPVTEQHEDFLDKTMQLEGAFTGLDPQYSDYLVQTIKSLDHGPEVLYYLANNLDEADKFVKAGPLGATLALGEINAMFKGQTRKQAKVSNAPPPPQVNKGSKTRTTIAADTDDLDAFTELLFKKPKRG